MMFLFIGDFVKFPVALYIHTYACLVFFPTNMEVVGCQVPKTFFTRNCMKCANLHRKVMFQTPIPKRVRVGVKYWKVFARNYMKCEDLYRKIMFLTPHQWHMGWL